MTLTSDKAIQPRKIAISEEVVRRIEARRHKAALRARGVASPATQFPSHKFPEFDVYSDQELRLMALDGDKLALEAFFQRHWKLIDSIARKIHFVLPEHLQLAVSLDDIKQIVVLDALKKLGNKLDHSAKSIAFGFNHLDGLKEARHQANGVRIPEGVNTLITKLRNFVRDKDAAEVSLEDIAEHLGIPVYPEINIRGEVSEDKVALVDVLRAMQFQNMGSIDAALPMNDDAAFALHLDTIDDLYSLTSDVPPDAEDLCAVTLAREAVWEALSEMKQSWREILVDAYGIRTGKPKRAEEVAAERGVTRQNINVMKSRALTRLGEPDRFGDNPLRDAYEMVDFR